MLCVGCYYCLCSLINNDGDVMKNQDQKDKSNEKNQSSENSEAPKKKNLPGMQRGMSIEEFLDPGIIFDAGFIDTPRDELLEIAHRINPHKPVRIIDQWTWLDVSVSPEKWVFFEAQGLKPAMLMALSIVYDSTQPDSIGNWVRTSPLAVFHEPGVFETRNRIYMMLNKGRRKSVTSDYIDSIVDW